MSEESRPASTERACSASPMPKSIELEKAEKRVRELEEEMIMKESQNREDSRRRACAEREIAHLSEILNSTRSQHVRDLRVRESEIHELKCKIQKCDLCIKKDNEIEKLKNECMESKWVPKFQECIADMKARVEEAGNMQQMKKDIKALKEENAKLRANVEKESQTRKRILAALGMTESEMNQSCSILGETCTSRKDVFLFPCGHTGCEACLRKAMEQKKTCPFCNAEVHEIKKMF